MFYKGLFDKLDIQAEIFRPTACRYKSAVEPYFLSKMSNANREQMQLLVDSYWNVMAEAVAESRGIELSTLNRLADGLEVSLAQEALDHGMVDGLLFEDQMDDVFREYGAVAKNDGQFEFVTLGQYVSQLNADLKNISSSQIAIVYADGAIVDGEALRCRYLRQYAGCEVGEAYVATTMSRPWCCVSIRRAAARWLRM